MSANYPVGTRFMSSGKHPHECTVTDILKTRDISGAIVKIRYVAIHNFCGQMVADADVCEVTIARGLIKDETK